MAAKTNRGLAFLKNQKIGIKILFGYIVALALAAIVGGLAIFQLDQVNATVNTLIHQLAQERALAEETAVQIYQLRFYANQYILQEQRPADLETYNHSLNDAQSLLNDAEQITTGDRAPLQAQMRDRFDRFAAAFAEIVQLLAARQETTDKILNPQSVVIADKLATLRNDSFESLDFTSAHYASQIRDSFSQMQVSVFRYLNTGNEVIANQVDEDYSSIRATFDLLRASVRDDSARNVVSEISAAASAYYEAFKTARVGVKRQHILIVNQLDRYGPEIDRIAGDVVKSINKEFTIQSQATSNLVMQTRVGVLATIMAVVIIGLVFSVVISRAITRPLEAIAAAAQRIAGGTLDNDVLEEGSDEVGILAGAFNHMTAQLRDMMQALLKSVESFQTSEEELKHTKNYLDNILNSMPSMLVGVNVEGHVTHWNSRASQLTGIERDQAYGRPVESLLPQFADYIDQFKQSIFDHQPRTIEKLETRPHGGGERRYVNVMVFPLEANAVEGAVIRVDDVTEQVRVEQIMIQTEKMMMVGGLAAGMAHEINNPLGAILQGAQNIERRLSLELTANLTTAEHLGVSLELIRAYLNERGIFQFLTGIRESGSRAARIVSNMLQFSRRSDSQRQLTSIPDLLNHAVELAANDYDLKKKYDFRHIEVIREYDPLLPDVSIITTELEQVILNLLKNAAHALMDREAAHMQDSDPAFEPPRIILRTKKQDQWAVIEVADNGCGMSEAIQKHIFEPFFTTKEVGMGTGLGLSVSYMIITNNHKGSIEVESTVNKGTTFIVRLPLAVAAVGS
jgi:PAS domain S-box-containing protein